MFAATRVTFSAATKKLAKAVFRSVGNMTKCYEDAVATLNTLQSNRAYIEERKQKRHNPLESTSLLNTTKYLLRSGITIEQLDDLSIIHVAGTKGKGSTCAFVESILREHKYHTGFFSSPHLINVFERFKIDGQSISESQFNHYFWKIYNILDAQKEDDNDLPKYFQFLTIMMFHIFLEANLDVAIVEVGIGGEFDCTNIIRNPICTGITTLGIDHTSLLGNTLPEIAYQKAGIMKKGVPSFTVPQPTVAMDVLKMRAKEKGCDLSVVPPLTDYPWVNQIPVLGIQSDVQSYNASLAIQLSNSFHSRVNIDHEKNKLRYATSDAVNTNLTLSMDKVSKAISSCRWPGRTQILHGKLADFYLDGAHTIESVQNCATWYENKIHNCKAKRYLIFNVTHDRNSEELLSILRRLNFERAFFVPNIAGCIKISDQNSITESLEYQMNKCRIRKENWGPGAEVTSSVGEALGMIASREMEGENKPSVLITGSLYLVGAALLILDPKLSMTTTL